MPTGQPGTGPTAGRKRDRSEAPRRRGALSQAERNLIQAIAWDQPGSPSERALERQVERLARVLRRSPAAVRQAFYVAQNDEARHLTWRSVTREIRTARRELADLTETFARFVKVVGDGAGASIGT